MDHSRSCASGCPRKSISAAALAFVSSHLGSLTDNAIDFLTDTEVAIIVGSEPLVAPSEDWLYDCISRRLKADLELVQLLE
jgi:hypothetical protein